MDVGSDVVVVVVDDDDRKIVVAVARAATAILMPVLVVGLPKVLVVLRLVVGKICRRPTASS